MSQYELQEQGKRSREEESRRNGFGRGNRSTFPAWLQDGDLRSSFFCISSKIVSIVCSAQIADCTCLAQIADCTRPAQIADCSINAHCTVDRCRTVDAEIIIIIMVEGMDIHGNLLHSVQSWLIVNFVRCLSAQIITYRTFR